MQQADSETTYNPLEDQWEVILDPYQDDPVKALILAQNFQAIKDVLEHGTIRNATGHSIDGRRDRDFVSVLRVLQSGS